jgi:hypothetical protein
MTDAAPTLATKERRVTWAVVGNFMKLQILSISMDATARAGLRLPVMMLALARVELVRD